MDSEELRWTEPNGPGEPNEVRDSLEPTTLAGIDLEPDAAGDDFPPGSRLGRYVILARQGVGGMGVVYAAYDPELDRRVALKLMHQRGTDPDDSQKAARRLLAEAKASAQLSHPNVIVVHDVGTIDGRVFLAMEFIDGEPLSKWMRAPGRDWKQLLDVFTKAGRGLEAAHEAGLVHRDFKPDNVLVGIDGRVRVSDFGLARRVDGSTELDRRDREAGTPVYMSPEQLLGRPLDHRSDQFSFCVALYEALYNELPFSARTRFELALAVTDGRVAPARRGAGVPNWVRYALLRGLDPDPEGRWEDMGALLNALARDPYHNLRMGLLWAGAVLVVLSLGVGLVKLSGNGSEAEADEPSEVEDPCASGDARMAKVWSTNREEVLRDAFAAVDKPWASELADEVVQGVGSWSRDWTGIYRDACEATYVQRSQSELLLDRRMVCLDQRLDELDELLELFIQGEPDVLARAGAAIADLPALDRCDADDLLLVRDFTPTNDEQRQLLEQLDEQLAEARALELAGEWKRASTIVEDCLGKARELRHPHRLAESLLLLATLRSRTDEADTAVALLDEALVAAERAGDDHLRARVLVASIRAAADAGEPALARQRADWARALLERIGASELEHAALDGAVALAYIAANRLDAAKTSLEAAIVRVEPLDPSAIELADLRNNLGMVLRDLGDLDAARVQFNQALVQWRERYGEQHPILAVALRNLADIEHRQGRREQALAHYEAALAILEPALGANDLEVGLTVESTAVVLHELGRSEDALRVYQRAQAIFRKQGALAELALALDQEGMLRRSLGQLERARALHEQALAAWEQALGANDPDLAHALTHLGEDLLLLGRPEPARAILARAVELLEHDYVGAPGATGRDAGLRARAALARFTLARAWASGDAADPERARELARAARLTYDELGRSADVEALDAWLLELG